MIRTFKETIESAKAKGPKTIAVAVAQDPEVLSAVNAAKKLGIAEAILVGDREEIIKASEECGIDIGKYEVIDIKDKNEASRKAVEMVSGGRAHIVMKGIVDTAIVLKAVLDENIGLRTGNVLSHVAVFEVPGYDRLFYVTDPAMILAPSLIQKKQIIENVVQVANALGNNNPKVAVLAAVEKVNPKMQATLDAAELVKMNESGELKGCVVGGPFALDNAISVEAARHKGVTHPVAGLADVLLVPFIEVGNVLYKSMVYYAGSKVAGILVGAKAPVVMTSRADSDEAKLNSIAIAVLMAGK
ncbi:MAG TPA: phosphate butyryltransferase [Bacillota bacterium]|nr:phosphate butyryltransferase [Bacillota bacterium]HNT03770.1 phosphate butyryltransferase [Bacillota bacterium]HPA53783.1 phosphate butyryltransferase [Bacillota bacterium]HQA64886.1 phosphate butyryltransferase [Bacillota bacterium]HQO42752.1 phosphate butyryltransferase [Bacillota bacterium]